MGEGKGDSDDDEVVAIAEAGENAFLFFSEGQRAWLGRKSDTQSRAYLRTYLETEEPASRDGSWLWRVTSVLLAVLVVSEPLMLAFSPRNVNDVLEFLSSGDTRRPWVVASRIVNVCWFSFDCVQARTWNDVLTTIPWELLVVLCDRDYYDGSEAWALVVDLIPVARTAKVHKLDSVRRALDDFYFLGIAPIWETLATFAAYAAVFNHLLACVWFSLGDRFRFDDRDLECALGVDDLIVNPKDYWTIVGNLDERCTWFQLAGLSRRWNSLHFLYWTSFYWALTTVTTVGYGDLTPNTVREKLFACACMLGGAGWFAGLVSAVHNDVFGSLDRGHSSSSSSSSDSDYYSQATQRRARKSLKAFLYKHKVPMDLSSAINTFLRRHFEVEQPWCSEDDFPEVSRLVKQLSKPLRRALALHVCRPQIRSIPFFHDKPQAFIADCVASMRSYGAAPGEVVVHKGTVLRALHLVARGSVDCAHLVLGAGDVFGEEGIILGAVWIQSLTARVWSNFHILTQAALDLKKHGDVARWLRASAQRKVRHAHGRSIFAIVDQLTSDNAAAALRRNKSKSMTSMTSVFSEHGYSDGLMDNDDDEDDDERARRNIVARLADIDRNIGVTLISHKAQLDDLHAQVKAAIEVALRGRSSSLSPYSVDPS